MSDVADKDWLDAYRRGRDGPWRTRDDVSSPPLSEEFKAHLAYVNGIINGIRELDTAQSERRIRRAMWILRGRRNARQA
jgi:hypothetical protein